MDFQTLFNQHIKELKLTTKELSEYTGLSPSTISRYRHGERTPLINSPQYTVLLQCLAEQGKELGLSGFEKENLQELYESILLKDEDHYQSFLKKFQLLLDHPAISIKELASTLTYDISYLYKIKNGQRRPQNLENFIEAISDYTSTLCTTPSQIMDLSASLNYELPTDADTSILKECLKSFFHSYSEEEVFPDASSFLAKLDNFNLEDFIEAIHFNNIKIPTLPFSITLSKTYYGLEKMREAELDFFKSTALSRSKADIFMHSDMPMMEMADNMDFNKKWMFGIAAAIKKGLHIQMIHHLDRPMEELMLGLEAWIPIYMTGQVLPYYLPSSSKNAPVYHHLTYVSGSCALSGQCIEGYHNDGRYELFTKQEDLQFFRKKADHILSKASPLMEIYTESQLTDFQKFVGTLADQGFQSIGENTFKNIKIKAYTDFVIVSKQVAPRIEFVIHHPILVNAIKNFKEACREN